MLSAAALSIKRDPVRDELRGASFAADVTPREVKRLLIAP